MSKKNPAHDIQDIQYVQPQTYVGVILIQGYRDVNEKGEDGYWVLTEPGRSNKKFWSTKENFEKLYTAIESKDSISDKDIENLIDTFIWKKVDERTILGIAILKTGFRLYATANCFNAKTDIEKCKDVCKEKIFRKIKSYLGFTTQWGTEGIKPKDITRSQSKYIDLTDLDDLEF